MNAIGVILMRSGYLKQYTIYRFHKDKLTHTFTNTQLEAKIQTNILIYTRLNCCTISYLNQLMKAKRPKRFEIYLH